LEAKHVKHDMELITANNRQGVGNREPGLPAPRSQINQKETIMATKKTTNKKAKTTKAKKAAPKKKPQSRAKAAATKAKAKAKAKAANAQRSSADEPDLTGMDLDIRRPNPTPSIPPLKQGEILETLDNLKANLETYAAHLRALDRRRLNGVGIKKQGFIERAYLLSVKNSEFLPHWLTVQKFNTDNTYFQNFRAMVDLTDQIRELLWNITIESSDMVYTDALEFYASVREAAKRRIDAAESIFNELSVFFKSRGRRSEEEPTEKQQLRDFKALQRGKRDGKIVIENIKPKLIGGEHKVIDETFRDTAEFKETDEGKITE